MPHRSLPPATAVGRFTFHLSPFTSLLFLALLLSLGTAGSVALGRPAAERRAVVTPAMRVRVPAVPSNPEVQKGLNAFGAGRYADARRIAEGLLKKPNRSSSHAEALDLLVESWLAQGNFAQARAAANRYHTQAPMQSKAALARINQQERDYRSELKRRQAERAKAKRPEQAALAQLMIGHLHHQYGRLDLAEAAYREVIARYPKTRAAARARRQLARLHGRSLGPLGRKTVKRSKAAGAAKAKPK